MKNPNQASPKSNRTRPEYRSHTGPPAQTEKPVCTASQAYTFQHDGVTCLLFPFKEGMAIEMGRLAMWRLQTHPHFGGTWLSDYVPNRLGGFLQEQEQRIVKPDCPLIGRDGNIYNLLGIAGQTLREYGMEQQATEMFNRITQCQSYDSALRIIGDYVNITPVEQTENMDMEMQ